jgi:hypothetical protein
MSLSRRPAGRPDWPIFRKMDDCSLWGSFKNDTSGPHFGATLFDVEGCELMSTRNAFGQHFGRFFHKLIGSPCPPARRKVLAPFYSTFSSSLSPGQPNHLLFFLLIFVTIYFSQVHTRARFYKSTAMCKDLKSLHPGEIRTRDLLFCRRTR